MKRLRIFGLAVSGFVLASGGVAIGDDFGGGPPEAGLLADSAIHTYCYDDMPAQFEDDVDIIMESALDVPTDMVDLFEAVCDENTDVFFAEVNLPSGIRGLH